MNINEFFHGIRGKREAQSDILPVVSSSGITFAVGTAPVHTLDDSSHAVNTPVLAGDFSAAQSSLGYSENWKKYSLGEVMQCHFRLYGTAPVMFVNVLDPAKHKKTTAPASFNIKDKRVILPFEAIKSSVQVTSPATVVDVDYTLFYSEDALILEILEDGTIPSDATTLTIGFDEIAPTLVTKDDIIGGRDVTTKKRSGLELIEIAFAMFTVPPDIIICPGWSSDSDVAAVMGAKANAYNIIFKGKALCDVDADIVKNADDVVGWKNDNGINNSSQVLCYPMVKNEGRIYHLSTHMAALMATVDAANDNVPSVSPSNERLLIDSAALADGTEVLFDLGEANYLNANGITTVLNMVGGFVLWGNSTAVFPDSDDPDEYFLYASRLSDWLSKTVILTYWAFVDGKIDRRLVDSIIDSLNIWLNSLTRQGNILGGRVEFPADMNSEESFKNGKNNFRISYAAPGIGQEIVFTLSHDSTYVTEFLASLTP